MTVILSGSDKSYLDFLPNWPGNAHGMSPWQWGRFEDMLEGYLEMFNQRRVIASDKPPQSNFEEGLDWPFELLERPPWFLNVDDEKVVELTVSAWENLLAAIESRIPTKASSSRGQPQFFSPEAIENCKIEGLFLKKFLQRARIPNFRYVAPGLRLALDDELPNQPFKDVGDLEQLSRFKYGDTDKEDIKYWCYPFLFLRFDQNIANYPFKVGEPFDPHKFNSFPWERLPNFETGLYVTTNRHMECPDGCRLLLPFPITPGKFAKFGDGRLLDAQRSYDGLYQPTNGGYHYATEMPHGANVDWNLRLELLFKQWTWMIENGHWDVGNGDEGVLGGAEKFKEADSDSKWHFYYIGRTG
jgi:hypothetical protein